MIRTVVALAAAMLLITSAFAQQQQPDPAFLQRALDSVAMQRNNALNAAAIAEAKAGTLEDQLAKAQARIKELEPKLEPKN